MRAASSPRDATLISVLAYAGLRPGEALALQWRDIREQTILVERAISLGERPSNLLVRRGFWGRQVWNRIPHLRTRQ